MKKSFLIILLMLSLGLTGCSLTANNSKTASGIFKSYDFGESWQEVNTANANNKATSLNNTNIKKIVFNPLDHKQIYLATEKGVWYSEDAANSWKNILPTSSIYDLAIDAKNNGVVYVTLGQQIYKSINLGQNWQQIYLENRANVLINALVIDPNNNLILYFGTSKGEIYQTKDGGESWRVINQAADSEDSIKKIIINPQNTKIIYAGLASRGILKSIDGGQTWNNLQKNFLSLTNNKGTRLYPGSETFCDLIFDLTANDSIIYASLYGLMKSTDGGQTWSGLNLLTPNNSTLINSIASNPKNKDQIYYTTNTVLYRSFDNGQTWLASSLPSNKYANQIEIDPETPNVLYLGLTSNAKKR